LKRSTLNNFVTQPADYATLTVVPYALAQSAGDGNASYSCNSTADWFSIIVPLFALCRGSIRLKLINSGSFNGKVITRLYKQRGLPAAGIIQPAIDSFFTYDSTYALNLMPFVITSGDELPQVAVPQYSRMHSFMTSTFITAGKWPSGLGPGYGQDDSYSPLNWVSFSSSDVQNPSWARSVGDDFQLGYFCCIPPMQLVTH